MDSAKEAELFEAIKKYNTSIILLQEIGLNWSRIPQSKQWWKRVETHIDKNQVKTRMAHNTNDYSTQQFQWGGTGILSYGKISHYSMGSGVDKSGLGRWTWARYRGRGGVVLRCVSVYMPCENKTGQLSVYAQQRAHFQRNNDDRCPRIAFFEDLDNALEEWRQAGDQIILGGDINLSVFDQQIEALMTKHYMHNLIFERHNPHNAPNTYRHNTTNKVIDSIWSTANIQAVHCGYHEAGEFPGDHSAVWVDLTYTQTLGHNPPSPQTFKARRLILGNTKCVDKYKSIYKSHVRTHNLGYQQFALERSTTIGQKLDANQIRVANNLDRCRTIGMNKAEAKCRKLHMGAQQFSDAISQPHKEIQFWDIAIKRRQTGKVSPKLWQRKKRAAKITKNTRTMTIDDMKKEHTAALNRYREAARRDTEARVRFMDTFSPKDKARLLRHEAQRRLARAAKQITGKLGNKSVTKVEHNGQECTTKETIEAALLPINAAKIRASDDTPFMQEPLVSEFGYLADTAAAERVLDGTYQPPEDIDTYARLLLTEFEKATNLPDDPTQAYISTEEHIQAWKKAKERTSAGPSGLHFGMFKANATDPELAAIDASMRSVAYTTGFAYDRWKKVLDVQILKRILDYRASKMRTILLIEADFNMNNKKLGRDVMWNGERAKALTRHNYGGRRNSRSAEVALNQFLSYDSIWGKRGRAVLISNDAKGCFDRIAHVVATLAMRRLGGRKTAIHSMLACIQEMDHHVRTAFGDSTDSYGNDPSKPPPAGVLQGNGSGPPCWSAICAGLVNAMKKAGFGYTTWTAISQKALEILCFAFVDDTDLIHNNDDPNVTTEQLIQEAQQALTTWEGLIKASGGQLAPEKSYWTLIEVHHTNSGWEYKSIADAPGELSLDNRGQPETIERCEVSQAKEALGIQMRPDGCMEDEFQYLLKKAQDWSEAIRTKRISPAEAWYCLNSTIMKTIEYPLMATTLTRKQLKAIMQPIRQAALPKCKIQRRIPSDLLYGTLQTKGFAANDPGHTQLIAHLQTILRHAHRDSPTHDLIQENMEIVQCHVGSSRPFWDLPYAPYAPLAPEGWIQFTWEELSHTQLELKGPLQCIPPQRTHDQHLMDSFVLQGYEGDELVILNDCRLYLNATTLADICTADGKTIDPMVWARQTPLKVRSKAWPRTYKPSQVKWEVWRFALRQTFLQPDSNRQRLRTPLGAWEHHADPLWRTWYSPGNNQMYLQTAQGQWDTWSAMQYGDSRVRYANPQQTPHGALPPDLKRSSFTRFGRTQWINRTGEGSLAPDKAPTVADLYTSLEKNHKNTHWATKHTQHQDNGKTVANAIRHGTAVAVSDGSFKMKYGTAAFVIEGNDSVNRIRGVNEVPGPLVDGDSHRCELAGLYGIVTLIQTICDMYQIKEGTVKVACDNEQALRCFDLDYAPDPNHRNFDLLQAVTYLSRQSPIQWKPQHVKGHQDKHKHRYLTRLERLNIEMDHLAKAFWTHCTTRHNSFPTSIHLQIHHEGWQLWKGDCKIASPHTKSLYATLQDPITQQWWVRNNYIKAEHVEQIDWEITGHMMQRLKPARRRWVTKHSSDNCGVGATLAYWRLQEDDECPRCKAPETTEHVLKCTAENASNTWKEKLAKVRQYLSAQQTHPDLQEYILLGIQRWQQEQPLDISEAEDEVADAIRSQHAIGWKNLLEGFMHTKWRKLQHRYYNNHNIRRSSKKWASGLLRALHTLAWSQWDHRNHIKHRTKRPRQRTAELQLHEEIIREYTKGPHTLPEGDHHYFNQNLMSLIQKPKRYKAAWYSNLQAARQRQLRIEQHNDELQQLSRTQSGVLQWIRTGRC